MKLAKVRLPDICLAGWRNGHGNYNSQCGTKLSAENSLGGFLLRDNYEALLNQSKLYGQMLRFVMSDISIY